jgi:hypothetical protein
MEEKELRVGAKIVVSTTDGEEEDVITRVLIDATETGMWLIETARNGRVVVMRGQEEQPAWAL